MFVDTSAIIAMMMREPEAADLGRRLDAASVRLTSPLVVLEASMILASRTDADPGIAEEHLQEFFDRVGISVAPINAADGRAAVEAFARYGKGRGHPARLNIADCMSYACASTRDLPLLYKGDDFSRTDLAYRTP